MKTKRIRKGNEELRIKGKTEGTCQIHDWPTPGLADRLIQAMRDRHPKGINACPECIGRASVDAHSGCCVCGRTELPHPDEQVSRQLGIDPPVGDRVTWRCQACKRKVCPDHVVTYTNDHGAREIPDKTLCVDPECVTARSPKEIVSEERLRDLAWEAIDSEPFDHAVCISPAEILWLLQQWPLGAEIVTDTRAEYAEEHSE